MCKRNSDLYIITAGSSYLDIDAYACMVATTELLNLQGVNAVAYSKALCNYSVCESLVTKGEILCDLPEGMSKKNVSYIIVDISDPEFLKSSVPLDCVVEVYDHHVGFEDYWHERIGDGAHIEFIGAAATLIYREWQSVDLQNEMSRKTALLLIAAILDNTLNLTSTNTTEEDIEVFNKLCAFACVGEDFRDSYFIEVQKSVGADLKNAIFGDIKTVRNNAILPENVAQLCIWNAESVLVRLPEIRGWFSRELWMINIIDLSKNCSFFVCDNIEYQQKIAHIFGVRFESGIAKTQVPYLRKQLIKRTLYAK
ncbi:MAG: DHH family protein [Clostridia bacterium]|nr:DHH family protein [Clostridia bacterium]